MPITVRVHKNICLEHILVFKGHNGQYRSPIGCFRFISLFVHFVVNAAAVIRISLREIH